MGRNTSGATNSTASAVVNDSAPPSRRSPKQHGHQPHTQAGDDLHGQGREERHPEGAHRRLSQPFVGRGHLPPSLLGPTECPERREPLDELEIAGARSDESRRHWRPVRRADSRPKNAIDTGPARRGPAGSGATASR